MPRLDFAESGSEEYVSVDAIPQKNQDVYLEIGKIYSCARQERRLKLSEVTDILYIRQVYIEAIEQGRFQELPGRVYALGFMKKYAELLQLDFQELQRRINWQDDNYTILSCEEIVQPYVTAGYKKYLWLSLVLTIIGGGLYTYIRRAYAPSTAVVAIPDPTIAEPVSSPQETIAEAPATEEPVEAPTTPKDKKDPAVISLRAIQPTWIKIRDASGVIVLERLLRTGEHYTLPQQAGLRMKIGNAGGLEVTKNDAILPKLGKPGQVLDVAVDEITFPAS